MKKGNKNALTRFTAIVLLVTMIALALISGTFAKYTTSKTSSDDAIVAKWAVKINGTDATSADEVSFDLFNDTGVFDLANVADVDDLSTEVGVIDEDVVKSDSKVAPGTWGKVAFNLENDSDVTATYAVNVTALTTTLPLEFSMDGKTWTAAADVTAPMSLGTGTLAIGSTAATTATTSLYWRWVYEKGADDALIANDAADTALGKAGTATCDITAGVVFTQAN